VTFTFYALIPNSTLFNSGLSIKIIDLLKLRLESRVSNLNGCSAVHTPHLLWPVATVRYISPSHFFTPLALKVYTTWAVRQMAGIFVRRAPCCRSPAGLVHCCCSAAAWLHVV